MQVTYTCGNWDRFAEGRPTAFVYRNLDSEDGQN